MKYFECGERVRMAYSQIGSGDIGFIPQAIAAAVRALDAIAEDPRVPEDLKERAALAAANLLMSDHQDD
ncbi:YaeP family protein [Pseudaeromonas paramecii]|uniref:YaeP family protein n=1 Tax=Pseudaeromonas paramecii TaxID=2138166 RepID=A0ABP8QGU0_9GAMM